MQYHSKHYPIDQAEKHLQCKWLSFFLFFPIFFFSFQISSSLLFHTFFSFFFLESFLRLFVCVCVQSPTHIVNYFCHLKFEWRAQQFSPLFPKPLFLLEKSCKIVTFLQLAQCLEALQLFSLHQHLHPTAAGVPAQEPSCSQPPSLCSLPHPLAAPCSLLWWELGLSLSLNPDPSLSQGSQALPR